MSTWMGYMLKNAFLGQFIPTFSKSLVKRILASWDSREGAHHGLASTAFVPGQFLDGVH
jgi:hypothetical protein